MFKPMAGVELLPVLVTTKPNNEIELVRHCGQHFHARALDVKKGWGLKCPKDCDSRNRGCSKYAPKPASGRSIEYEINKRLPDGKPSRVNKRRHHPRTTGRANSKK